MKSATELIYDYYEQRLTDAEFDHLAHLLRTDPAVAAAFARWSMSTSHLSENTVREDENARPSAPAAISNFQFSIFNLQFQLLAAALLAACGVAIYVFVSSLPQSEFPDPTSPAPLATLIESTPGSHLTTPGGFISDGRDYPRGEYTLDTGSAEFMLTNSVNVRLSGTTRLRMHSDMRVALLDGRAAFVVPPDAVGFTVEVPGGTRVVDLGTAFVVDTNDRRETFVRVTDGAVRLEYPDVGATGSAAAVLGAGQTAMLVTDDAGATRRVAERLIYAHDFDGPPARALNGTAPDDSDRGVLWSAHESWNADGTKPSPGTASATLPFTPEPGRVYTLSVDANPDHTSSTDWFGLGFVEHAAPNGTIHQSGDAAWMLVRMDDSAPDVIQTFHGPVIHGRTNHDLDPDAAGPVRLTVVLDTREPKWTVEWRADGERIRGPYEYDTHPTITRVGFDALGVAVGSVDNFRLTEFAGAPRVSVEKNPFETSQP